jgi:hypothetical protein
MFLSEVEIKLKNTDDVDKQVRKEHCQILSVHNSVRKSLQVQVLKHHWKLGFFSALSVGVHDFSDASMNHTKTMKLQIGPHSTNRSAVDFAHDQYEVPSTKHLATYIFPEPHFPSPICH